MCLKSRICSLTHWWKVISCRYHILIFTVLERGTYISSLSQICFVWHHNPMYIILYITFIGCDRYYYYYYYYLWCKNNVIFHAEMHFFFCCTFKSCRFTLIYKVQFHKFFMCNFEGASCIILQVFSVCCSSPHYYLFNLLCIFYVSLIL